MPRETTETKLSVSTNPWTQSSKERVKQVTTLLKTANEKGIKIFGIKEVIHSAGIPNETGKTLYIKSAEWKSPEEQKAILEGEIQKAETKKQKNPDELEKLRKQLKNIETTDEIKARIKVLEKQSANDPNNDELKKLIVADKGKIYGQPCAKKNLVKTNFVFDPETKKIEVLIYVNDRESFYKKNHLVKGSEVVHITQDPTIRTIELTELGKEYTYPWENHLPEDKRTVLHGDPETHVSVKYINDKGQKEEYPIKSTEAAISMRYSSDKAELKEYADSDKKESINAAKEILTLEKESKYITSRIEKQLAEGKEDIILDYKEITDSFNENEKAFLQMLPTATIEELMEQENILDPYQESNELIFNQESENFAASAAYGDNKPPEEKSLQKEIEDFDIGTSNYEYDNERILSFDTEDVSNTFPEEKSFEETLNIVDTYESDEEEIAKRIPTLG